MILGVVLESFVKQIIEKLRERDQTLCLAESCTGGRVSSEIVNLPGVSDVFVGSFVTYSNSMKREILGVPPQLLKTLGTVSPSTALHMARGAINKSHSTWAVAVTGIAGPSGGTKQKPVGTVCFAIVGPGVEWTKTQFFSGSRSEIQKSSTKFILQSLLDKLLEP